jgi:hypothetical protein
MIVTVNEGPVYVCMDRGKDAVMTLSARLLFTCMLLALAPLAMAGTIYDGHIHYNGDSARLITAKRAIELLNENGIESAIVSSTPNAGTKMLHQHAPERIIPFLRPYRTYNDRYGWHSDPDIIPYLEQELSSGIYRGIGEFHLFSEHKNTAVVQKVLQLAKAKRLVISAHADVETIETLASGHPDLAVIWAHCGFDYPAGGIRQLMIQNKNLYCELSFREGIMDENFEQLDPEWKELFESHPQRFMLGMDTYTPQRWVNLPVLTDEAHAWLDQLDPEAAAQIRSGTIQHLFP